MQRIRKNDKDLIIRLKFKCKQVKFIDIVIITLDVFANSSVDLLEMLTDVEFNQNGNITDSLSQWRL